MPKQKFFTIECWDGEKLPPKRTKTAALRSAFEVIDGLVEHDKKKDDREHVQFRLKEIAELRQRGELEEALQDWNVLTNEAWDGSGEIHIEEQEL